MSSPASACCAKPPIRPGRITFFFRRPQGDYRDIPCRPKGLPRRAGGAPEWEYEERDGRLFLTPSLHCTDTGFHTAFDWSVEYEILPAGIGVMDHLFAINPGMQP